MTLQQVVLHLSLIDGIGPRTIQKIIEYVGLENFESIYSLTTFDYIRCGFLEKIANQLVAGLKNKDLLYQELNLIEKNAINWISIFDSDYPSLLKHIYLPPPILYWKGNLTHSEKRLAIVGSRKTNQYGKDVITSIVPLLVAHNFEIVSGGALGADTMAHQQTINAHGTTIIVLGSGLLKPYPRENKKLFEQAVDGEGALVSPFPLQTAPLQGNFPARNRIISGLSKGVLVVQAAEKSGAKITAQFALEQGREVFAVPGMLSDELSAGCHALIKEGAKLVTSIDDIIGEFDLLPCDKKPIPIQVITHQTNVRIKNSLYAKDSIEEKIIEACKKPCNLDELSLITGLSLCELQTTLCDMQMEGFVIQDFTGMWRVA